MADRAPPSRARRLWVQERLQQARRAADLLDRKRQILRREEARALTTLQVASGEWGRISRSAAGRALRAEALAGSWAVEVAARPLQGRARIEVDQQETAGVAHPGDARLDPATPTGLQAAASGPLLTAAAEVHAEALAAAARLAVADTTLRRLREERLLTERRQRAVTRIRIPALEDELRLLNERLEELERQDQVVVRWISDRRDGEGEVMPPGL